MTMITTRVGIGIDVGGTLTKIAVVSAAGRRLCDLEIATHAGRGPREFVERVCALIGGAMGSLCAGRRRPGSRASFRAAKRRASWIAGVGVGLAGDVDGRRGTLRFSPNLSGFAGFSFKKAFQAELKAPVVVDNDANMAAWGGYVVEMKRRPRNMVCLTLGTGVGGGLVLAGKLFHGATGTAGEIGHMLVEPDGEMCRCGMRGCLEAYAGAYGIVRTARKLLDAPSGRRSLLRRLCPNLKRLDPVVIEAAARKGDRVALSVWKTTGHYLGLGISNLIYLFNPDAVLIVGGVSKAGALILKPALEVLRARPFKAPFRHARIRVARAARLGAVGAALAGLEGEPERSA